MLFFIGKTLCRTHRPYQWSIYRQINDRGIWPARLASGVARLRLTECAQAVAGEIVDHRDLENRLEDAGFQVQREVAVRIHFDCFRKGFWLDLLVAVQMRCYTCEVNRIWLVCMGTHRAEPAIWPESLCSGTLLISPAQANTRASSAHAQQRNPLEFHAYEAIRTTRPTLAGGSSPEIDRPSKRNRWSRCRE